MNISLLFPYGEKRMKNTDFYAGLGLDKSVFVGENEATGKSRRFFGPSDLTMKSPENYLTDDTETIIHRTEIIGDLLFSPELCALLDEAVLRINDIRQLITTKALAGRTESMLYSVCELETYVETITFLQNGLSGFESRVASEGLKELIRLIDDVYYSEDFKSIKSESAALAGEIKSVKSITVGINLNAQLQATEAGIISVNTEKYKSGDIIDRLLRAEVKNDKYTCITPLSVVTKSAFFGESSANDSSLNMALMRGFDTIFAASLKRWQPTIRKYMQMNTKFLLDIAEELTFLTAACAMLRELKRRGCALCRPETYPENERKAELYGLYNPLIALKSEDEQVVNDIEFTSASIYILTGANRGGKSYFTGAVALAFAFFHLGLYLPCDHAALSPVDGIYVHLPSSGDNFGTGRLGEECERLSKIVTAATDRSLVIMDETFSSTDAAEASYIAGEILCGFGLIGSKVVFATHLHELAASAEALDEKIRKIGGKGVIDNLSVGITGEERNFKVFRRKPEGKSHAQSIAEKYGLSLSAVQKLHNK